MKHHQVICLMGPTAAGKTKVGITLSKKLPCDIISVDSGMIYRGMDIGTAKPTIEEQKIAPHRLINIIDPSETYSAGQFRLDAIQEIKNILANGRIPLLVGGTMLYFKVLQGGLSVLPEADATVREKILQDAEQLGWQVLHEKLAEIDPISAGRIHPCDSQRLQRALEVYELTGKSMTELFIEKSVEPAPYEFLNLALIPADRSILHEHIEKRFDQMLELGFIEEIEKLFERGDLHPDMASMRTVGYRQAWRYLAGETKFNKMREQVIAATRQLAKRQLTWLRSWGQIHCIDNEANNVFNRILRIIFNNREIL